MNAKLETSRPPSRGSRRFSAWAGLLLAITAGGCLTGCMLFNKPAIDATRHFVLTPLPPARPAMAHGGMGVGVSQVKLPDYLSNKSLAVRKGTNEIEYLPLALWAEDLDTGFQRVLAANLSSLLPTDQIRLSTWRSEEVAAEVEVTIQQFDVDSSGRAALVAWWRVLSPGKEKTFKAGVSRLSRQGPLPAADPSGAVATLSGLMADFCRELAQALKGSEAARDRPL
jgi:uncharacterized lipoprotein YmbA